MRRLAIFLTTTMLAAAPVCFGQGHDYGRDQNRREWAQVIPAGTRLEVRTDSWIDVNHRSDGRIFPGNIAQDVYAPDGDLLIPRGADVELIVQNLPHRTMAIDLDSIQFNGHRYMVNAAIYRRSRRDGVGANGRTGEYVGGGAALGSIIGAIAGGGKGAAIGALAGAAGGAGAEIATRGDRIHIPPETVLTFRLDDPLTVSTGPDRGFDRGGYHYHDGYYDRNHDTGYNRHNH